MKLFLFILAFILDLYVYGQRCLSNCSTMSAYQQNGTAEFVQCTIQKRLCDNLTDKGGVPTKPDKLSANWFLYEDPDNNTYQKVGLNFSWSPGDDYSIKQLAGYKITLTGFNTDIVKTEYLCFSDPLSYLAHVKTSFYHDCFGFMDNLSLLPGRSFVVSIRSLPEPHPDFNDQLLRFSIVVPSCNNSTMQFVQECYDQNMSLYIESHSCQNRSIKIVYHLLKPKATIMLGEFKPGNPMPLPVRIWNTLPGNGSFVLNIPTSHSLLNDYAVVLWAEDESNFRKSQQFTLKKCSIQVFQIKNQFFLFFIPIIFILSAAFIWYNRRHLKPLIEKGLHSKCHHNLEAMSKQLNNDDLFDMMQLPSEKRIKIYIVFVDDHPYHREIVLLFSSFLEADLGFSVTLELYQTKEIYADSVGWMDKNMRSADKVIIIWSPGAAVRWYAYNDDNTVEYDYFTPVVRNVYKDLFRDKKSSKYLFVFFDYCSKDNIPSLFIQEYPHLHYKLMEEIDELFFRLQGVEKYSPGVFLKQKKVDLHSYIDPHINKYGQALHKKLCNMCNYVLENPLWYKEQSSKVNKLSEQTFRLFNDTSDEITCNIIDIIPPNSLKNDSMLPETFDESNQSYFDKHSRKYVSVPTLKNFGGVVIFSGNKCLSNHNSFQKQDVINVPNLNLYSFLNATMKKKISIKPFKKDCHNNKNNAESYLNRFCNADSGYATISNQITVEPVTTGQSSSEIQVQDVNQNMQFFEKELLANSKNRNSIAVALSPIDLEADPIKSLMSINGFPPC